MVVFSLGKTFYLSKFRILLSFSVSTLWWCLEKGGIRGVWCFDSIFKWIQENQLWQTSFFQWEIRQKQVEKSQIGKCAKTRFTFNLDERKTPWQDFETYSGMCFSVPRFWAPDSSLVNYLAKAINKKITSNFIGFSRVCFRGFKNQFISSPLVPNVKCNEIGIFKSAK